MLQRCSQFSNNNDSKNNLWKQGYYCKTPVTLNDSIFINTQFFSE